MRAGATKKLVTFDQQIALRPLPQNAMGPFCCVCRGPVDSERIEDECRGQIRNSVTIRVTCHGKEEVAVFEFGSMLWDQDDIRRGMQRIAWFHPSHTEVGGIANRGEG